MNRTPKFFRLHPGLVLGAGASLIVAAYFLQWRPLTMIANVVGGLCLAYVVLPAFYYMVKNTINDWRGK